MQAVHILGCLKVGADAISRDNFPHAGSRGSCKVFTCLSSPNWPPGTSTTRLDLSHGTMNSYLVVIRFEQMSWGMRNPNIGSMPKLTPASVWEWLLITPRIFPEAKAGLAKNPAKRNAQMLWAAAYGSNHNAVAHCLHGQTGGGYLTLGKFVSSVWVALDAACLVAKNFVKTQDIVSALVQPQQQLSVGYKMQWSKLLEDGRAWCIHSYLGSTWGALQGVSHTADWDGHRSGTVWMTIEYWTHDNNLAKNNWLEQSAVYYSELPKSHNFRIRW